MKLRKYSIKYYKLWAGNNNRYMSYGRNKGKVRLNKRHTAKIRNIRTYDTYRNKYSYEILKGYSDVCTHWKWIHTGLIRSRIEDVRYDVRRSRVPAVPSWLEYKRYKRYLTSETNLIQVFWRHVFIITR